MLCKARHVERRVCAGFEWEEDGESGGDAKRADWKRVFGVDVVSHVNALGSNMIAIIVMYFVRIVVANFAREWVDSRESVSERNQCAGSVRSCAMLQWEFESWFGRLGMFDMYR